MSPKGGKDRRKGHFINREIQVSFTLQFIFIFIIFIFLSTLVVFIPSSIRLFSGAPVEELIEPSREFLTLHKRIWPMILIVVIGTIIYSIRFTHRIVGPIHRLNKELRNMISGNYPVKITLRKKDYFKETASLLEELAEILREKDDL